MSAAVRFELAPSWLLAAAVVAAHAAAAFCAYLVLRGWQGGLLAAALVALGAAAAWSRALLRAGDSVRAIEIAGEAVRCQLTNGEIVSVKAGTRRYVSRWLVSLPLGQPLGRTLLVTGDMLGAAQFRRLRIWALWNRLPSERPAVAPKQLPA